MQKNDNFIFSHLDCYAIFLKISLIFLKLHQIHAQLLGSWAHMTSIWWARSSLLVNLS